jgi:organic radical activating enzyme
MERIIMEVRTVQFVDRNISRKDFPSISGLRVTSIFFTLQGEGPEAFKPAVFVRLSGCNRGNKVDCPWCDTNFLFDQGKQMSIKQIVAKVEEHGNKYSKDKPIVVITGGEPLLQAEQLELLVAELHELGYVVQIETNGDLLRHDSLPRAIIVCSPKVSMRTKQYKKLPIGALARADYLKFLVEDKPDSPYRDVPAYAMDFADVKGSYHVLLSPVSEYRRDIRPKEIASMWSDLFDMEVAKRNHRYVAKLTMEHGFRASMQAHLFLELE